MCLHTSEFQFETVLGKGTFGTVHLVRRKKDFKPFVIKQQYLSAENTASLKMVIEEVKCLQRMRHPNIVAYYGGWRDNNYNYILMEYATRGTLKDLLERRKLPLKEEDALYLFSQVTLGVHHIHSKKILHRDLKPENIMLTGRCGDIVKIVDFGVSKNIQEESVMCRAGSFYYMAPEMLANQPYDFKCDIWSMGVVLYEMITKELPFAATNLTDVITMVAKNKPKPLSKSVSARIVNLISKMLRKQAAYRPTTCQLVHCPYLVPYVVRIYLNLGRSPNVADRQPENFGSHIFTNFLKPKPASPARSKNTTL